MKKFLLASVALVLASPAQAGGQLDTFRFTGQSTVFAGFEDVDVVPIFWDERCSSIEYTVDTIPATGPAGSLIDPATIAAEMQASLDPWNAIPTSFISMNVKEVRTIGNGTRRFDFINELTFETPAGSTFLASSPSTSLQEDATFSVGDDIDGDGDSDVFDPAAAGRNSCFDFDDDGDIEFPAGDYKAGTILDNDVQYNNVFAWELTPSSTLPGGQRLTDIQAVAVHEFGHSHGLAHSLINQISDQDGTGSTMFPFIDIDDRFSELGSRTLHDDDIAWSSFVYPEGSGTSGPSALQPGDVAFSSVYNTISGSYTQAGVGVLGGNIKATAVNSKRTAHEAYSGRARLFSPDGVGLFLGGTATILSGDYVMPVRRGVYALSLEALDGEPASGGNISFTAQIGGILGQLTYPEEFRSAIGLEGDLERTPGQSTPVQANNRPQTGIDVVTNRNIVLRNAGPTTNFIGTGLAIGFTDVVYAERFTNAQVLPLLDGGATLTTGLYRTGVFDASVVSTWEKAGLYFGRAVAGGTAEIDLANPIAQTTEFVGQDGDLTPLFFENPELLSFNVRTALAADPTLDLFLVIAAKNDFARADDPRPPLIGVSTAGAVGTSYLSRAGAPFTQLGALGSTSRLIMELRFTPAQ